ncbi:hypothetical protein [Pirellulimonas nuda]|uniref:hypothetical protein n=1 Tax=Pirellulimonas nuda TaxID=2528009 RepID=UPI0011A51E00|nr:hypothetical protein [Pirellulimonas nuda]
MDWDHPFNVAVVTVDEVIAGERDVVLVMHDEGHCGFQFYDGYDVGGRKPLVVPREVILELDSTLAEVTDLPVGWSARREKKGSEWTREQSADV